MNNSFILQVQKPLLISVNGTEGLSVGESLGLKLSEIGQGMKEAFRTLKSSAHVIDYRPTAKHLLKVNYFKHTMVPLTGPSYFDPDKENWAYYVKMISTVSLLISTAITESGRIYKWFKDVAKTGKVGTPFWYSVSKTDNLVNDLQSFMEGLKETRNVTHRLNQYYDSFREFYEIIDHFNISAGSIKSADIQSLSERVSDVYEVGDIVVNKIKESLMVLDRDQVNKLQSVMNDYNRLINVTGAGIILFNELTAVLETQAKELKTL